jgi:riboflavin transporter FmnP
MVTSGAIVRVLVMTLLNYVIIFLLFPFFSDIASKTLTSLGFKFRSSFEAMLWILVFIAIFNVLHTLLSVLLSLFIVRAVLKHLKFIPQPT